VWGGYYPFGGDKCICLNARFDLDLFGRSFIPESTRASVMIVDTNGNFIQRIGSYGNADEKGPEIRIAYMRYVAVNDKKLFINDSPNKRILSIDLKYHKEEVVGVK